MTSNWMLGLFLLLLFSKTLSEIFLLLLNRKEVLKHRGARPVAFKAVMDEETFTKSTDYSLAKIRLGLCECCFDAAITAAVVLSGILAPSYDWLCDQWGESIWTGAAYLFVAGVLLSGLSLPFRWYGKFRIEERFGFNNSTYQIWMTDLIKGFFLAVLLGFPLICLLLKLIDWTGTYWWAYGFGAFFGFQILMMLVYPRFILPLFNKLEPLPEGDLRSRLLALATRTGFNASTVQVVDGSKRSTHSNAYFTGFGRFRRIVLFDTLVAQFTPGELEAVLAHEIGHYKKGHIPKGLVISAVMTLAGFAALAYLAECGWFYEGFGFETASLAPAFLLSGLLGGLVSFWVTPLFSILSRKHEYEADAFAADATGGPGNLVAALRKLAEKNLSNLTPHPLYSGFYCSHPSLLEREGALKASFLNLFE